MKNEKWQYKGVMSSDWETDQKAMNNPKFKTFEDYRKLVERLNKKYKYNPPIECRVLTPANLSTK